MEEDDAQRVLAEIEELRNELKLRVHAIGVTAAFFSIGAYMPQAYMVYKTNSTKGLSLLTYTLYFIGASLWFIYALLNKDYIFAVSSSVAITIAVFMLYKIRQNAHIHRIDAA